MTDEFRVVYEDARVEEARAAPILVLLADRLVVCHGQTETSHAVTSAAFHLIKRAAHCPVAMFAELYLVPDAPFDVAVARRLEMIREGMRRTEGELACLSREAEADVREVIDRTMPVVAQLLAERRASHALLLAFAEDMGPLLLRLTTHGTAVMLDCLHRAVEDALEALDSDVRRALFVVVGGDHQARARNLGMQYFRKRFGETPERENRVLYGESLDDVDDARRLVGTLRADRAIAAAFFGDAKRLQQDVLGDAAAALLAARPLEIIG